MKQEIIDTINQACVELYGDDVAVELERPEEQFGDYSTNVAMKLAGSLKINPREVAQEISESLNQYEIFEGVGVAGPGFINITLSNEYLVKSLEIETLEPLKGLKVLVEYSDPNPFKPLHAGHLYTTLVGDVIARLVQESGAETIRLNYGGDVGLHVAKSMWAIINVLGGEHPEKLDDLEVGSVAQWMGDRYVEGNNAFEDDENAKQEIIEINKRVYSIHERNDHDSAFARIYWCLRDASYDFFKDLYKQLQVSEFDRYIPESEVTKLGLDTVKKQLENGVFEESQGAVIFDGEKHDLHKRVFINSEGLPTYETKDVGLSLTKWNDYHFDESIIITANEQSQYMQVVLKAIEQFEPEPAQKTRHITHGVVKLSGGVKMSSRKGSVLYAKDIIDSASEAGKESGAANDDSIVLAAIKYAFLKNKIGGDIVYDPKESITMEGNSGPYLQYAHARACSILRKSTREPGFIGSDLDESERELVRKISEYQEVVNKAAMELSPHIICGYLYELSQHFNRFYENSKVISSDREEIRINIVNKYAQTLKSGLNMLGIIAPESM